MLKWYDNLYISKSLKAKSKHIIRKINDNKLPFNIYIITLATNEANHLDIVNSNYLRQKSLHSTLPMIVGIASGYEAALDIVKTITEEVYTKTQGTDIRSFLVGHNKIS